MAGRQLCPWTIWAVLLVHWLAAPVGATPKAAGGGSVFDKASPGVRLPGRMPGTFYSGLRRTSPDGKYVAWLYCGDAEVGYLAVYRRGEGGWRLTRQGRISRLFGDVHGCAWVPRHGHWLLVSAGGADYGPGLLALWSGPNRTRLLRRARTPDGEGFNVRSVSQDGHRVVYDHLGADRNTRQHLTLPRS